MIIGVLDNCPVGGDLGRNVKSVMRWLILLFFISGGLAHFLFVDDFAAIVPPMLPFPKWIVWATGVFELAIAPLIFVLSLRVKVGRVMALYCLAVLPANIYQLYLESGGPDSDTTLLWLRIPLQFVLIGAILWATGDDRRRVIRLNDNNVTTTRG